MINENFNSVLINENQQVIFKYPKLASLFVMFSLLFSASIVGLFVNLIINSHNPLTHTFFVIGIFVSILAGIVVNSLANYKARKSAQSRINQLLKNDE